MQRGSMRRALCATNAFGRTLEMYRTFNTRLAVGVRWIRVM